MRDAVPPSPQSPPASLLPPYFEATTSITPLSSAFDQTTRNLLKLGSLPMDKFAQDPSEELDGFDIPLLDAANPNAAGYYLGETGTRKSGNEEEASEEIPNVAPSEAVRYLREVVVREFGTTNADPLKYEFLEDFGQNRGCCILTITRPNGLSRSYRTKAEFIRRSEAKVDAASSAIKLGAVYFIKHGEASKLAGKRGLVLAKLDAGMKKDEKGESNVIKLDDQPEDEQDDSAVAQIEMCCIEWRAGSVIPKWVHLADPKFVNAHGYVLKISLSSNIQRAYSVLSSEDYPRRFTAKAACARAALEQNVLEFIKHGDGLEHPIVVPFAGAEAVPPPPPPTATTLQAFHAALPKPLPDHIGMKANGEINAVGWLNTTIQMAKGSRMTVTFTWYTDTKLGLHGCLLRLSRPDSTPAQSYLVDAIFPKRADAKIAVCLLACSQGVGNYIREIAAEVDSRVTAEMRRRSTEHILPALGQALNRFKHGYRPEFLYDSDVATYGCTLTIDLSPDPDTPIKKEWKVPLAYKSKVDAKVAVACIAADGGVLDFIRNRGNNPSDQPVKDSQDAKQADVELEEGETTEIVKKKKKKKGKRDDTAGGGAGVADEGEDVEAELLKKVRNSRKTEPIFETREEALAKGRFGPRPQKQLQRNFAGGWARGGGPGDRRFGGHTRVPPGYGPHRPSGGFSGFPAHPGLRPPIHSSHVPPSFPHSHGHAPLTTPPAYGPGYLGNDYGVEHDHRDGGYLFHDHSDPELAYTRHMRRPGAAGANAATPFVHAPLPVPPRVAPGYRGYNDRPRDYDYGPERNYRRGPYASQTFSGAVTPYRYEYPPAAARSPPSPPPHAYSQSGAAEYSYAHEEYADPPAHGVPYESDHHAPDYDRIPDHSVAMALQPHQRSPSHTWRFQSPSLSSHLHNSVPPRRPPGFTPYTEHRAPVAPQRFRASFNRPPVQSGPDIAQEGGATYGRVAHGEKPHIAGPSRRQSDDLVKPASDPQANLAEELDTVIYRLEKEADEKAANSLNTKHRLRDTNDRRQDSDPLSSRSASRSLDRDTFPSEQASVVPSKRGRSSDREDRDPRSNKRTHEHSGSTSRSSERGRSTNRRVREGSSGRSKSILREEPGLGREKSISPSTVANEDGEKKTLKRAREASPARKKRKGDEQKEKSYVIALFDHCDKEGISRPELCHEEISSEPDGNEKVFKVWIVMGKERLELPTSFKTLTAGQERVAKSVLGRLRVQTKKKKEA